MVRLFNVSISILFAFIFSCENKRPRIVSLPLTYRDGYGPFVPGWSILHDERKDDSPWCKTYLSIRGVPKGWRHLKKSMIWMDSRQFAYQNLKSGNISQEFYAQLAPIWKLDPVKLSAKSIKCFVYVIWGVNAKGNWGAMVDTNNNLDFSDEVEIDMETLKGPEDGRSGTNGRMVTFETFQNGRVTEMKIPLVINQMREDFVYSFPRHAAAKLRNDGKVYEILIAPSGPTFETSNIAYVNGKGSSKIFYDDCIKQGQILELGGVLDKLEFKNLGVDWYNETLSLEGFASDQMVYILQPGYKFQPFEAKEFTTGRLVSSSDLNGKYVFVDFWGTWCRGCMEDMPELNRIYNLVDTSKFEFVGVAADNDLQLSRAIKNLRINWPQFQSDGNGDLVKQYGVTQFPTSVLLDKNGKIIAMNLRALDLQKKLFELSK